MSGDNYVYYSYYSVYYIVIDDVIQAVIVVTIEPRIPVYTDYHKAYRNAANTHCWVRYMHQDPWR